MIVRRGDADFLVPNELEQEQAGQRQERSSGETAAQFSYQRIFSGRVVADFRGMARDLSATLRSNAQSTPIIASQDRGFRELYLTNPSEAHDPRVSPLLARDMKGLPPALIVAAGCDVLRDEGNEYAARLREAGVPVDYRCFEGTIHAFMSFCSAIPLGREALALAASRLRTALE